MTTLADLKKVRQELNTKTPLLFQGEVFDAFEKRVWKARMLGINDYKSKFESGAINYVLVYGDYNKEHNKNI